MLGEWGLNLIGFIRDGLLRLLASMLGKILSFFLGVVNWLVSAVVQVLPRSPFAELDLTLPTQWAGWINWALPVGVFLQILATWAAAVAVWYVVRWLLKLFHVI